MDATLIPILSQFATGVPWLDHAMRVAFILYLVYSVFLNILVQVSPDAANWTWVRVSLALVANVKVIVTKILVKPAPPVEPPTTGYASPPPDFDPPTKPELRTRIDNPKPPEPM